MIAGGGGVAKGLQSFFRWVPAPGLPANASGDSGEPRKALGGTGNDNKEGQENGLLYVGTSMHPCCAVLQQRRSSKRRRLTISAPVLREK